MSEPFFEASVRLRPDLTTFQQEAEAGIKQRLDSVEQQNNQRLRQMEQKAATPVVPPPPPIPPIPPATPGTTTLDTLIAQSNEAAQRLADLKSQYGDLTKQVQGYLDIERQAKEAGGPLLEAFERSAAKEDLPGLQERLSGLQREIFFQNEAALAAKNRAREQFRAEQGLTSQKQQQVSETAALLEAESRLAAERSKHAGATGDPFEQQVQDLESQILKKQSESDQALFEAQAFMTQMAEAEGAKKAALRADAGASATAAERLALEAQHLERVRDQLVASGRLPVDPSGDPRQDRQGGLTGFLRAGTAGRSSGLPGLLGAGLRLGAVGFAATAAFQAFSELNQMLRVTGDEAFTTEGRLRNLGAELLSGNIIGGIRALTQVKQDTFVGPILEEMQRLKVATDETIISTDQLLALQASTNTASQLTRDTGPPQERAEVLARRSGFDKKATEDASDALHEFLEAEVFAGRVTDEYAEQVEKAAVSLFKQAKFATAAQEALIDYTRAVEAAGSAEQKFGREGGPLGRRGPGARDIEAIRAGQGTVGAVVGQQTTGIPRPIVTNPFENPVFRAVDPSLSQRLRDSLSQRLEDEQERAKFDLETARAAQRSARAAFETAKASAQSNREVNGAAEEFVALREATTGVANAAAGVKAAAAAAAANTRAIQSSIADARISAIADPEDRSAASLARAKLEVTQARAFFQAQEKGTEEAERAYGDLRIKQYRVTEIQNDIAATAKEQAEAAAETAKQKAKEREANEKALAQSQQNAVEQGLANTLAKAQLSGNRNLIIKAFNDEINYWRRRMTSAPTPEMREAAEAQVIGFRSGLKSALQGAVDGGMSPAEELQLQKIQNRISAAQLDEGKENDKRAADDLIRFWQRQVKEAEGLEKERARAQLISAKLARKALDDVGGATDETSVFELLLGTARKFSDFAGDLITVDNPFTRESFTGEVAQYFKPGLTAADQLFAGPTGFTAGLGDFEDRARRNNKIPGGGLEGSVDRNTTATDNLTAAINSLNGSPIGRNDRRFGLSYGDVQGARGKAMGEFWKARQARQATEAGVGATRAGI